MFEIGDEVKVVNFPQLDGLIGTLEEIIYDGPGDIFYRVMLNVQEGDTVRFNPFPFMKDEIELIKGHTWEV